MHTKDTRGLASIIVPVWNQLEFTRQCIAALKRYTRPPWELIAVDNGSTDHTDLYLAGVEDAANVPVTIISNTTNRGFPAAINQGLKVARGEYLVMLNNDVVVTDGWLDQLIALANTKTDRFTAEIAEDAETKTETGNRDDGTGTESGGQRAASTGGNAGAEAAEGTQGRPPVARGAGSGDPRTTQVAPAAGPGDRRAARASSSLPTAYCLPPTARAIGLVGPMSNYAAPPQLVENVPYHDLPAMHGFARHWRDEHRGKWFRARKLSGFCLLMKRVVYETIGGLDERFGIGFFDDDDLAERARRAGFELVVAQDLFVHHFGSRTFQGNGIGAEKLLEENGRRFAEKWGLKGAGGKAVLLRPWRASAESHAAGGETADGRGEEDLTQSRKDAKDAKRSMAESRGDSQIRLRTDELDLGQVGYEQEQVSASSFASVRSSSIDRANAPVTARRAKVSLTMIVRDEEENLPRCLESVRGLFDEIVVVDTGSVDRTKEIAREFGARVFDFVWIDDFAAARNEALSHATGDYAFWLDADDVVEPAEREKLRALLGGLAVAAARSEPRGPRSVGARSVAAPQFPLTRPLGDLSPGGRGEEMRPNDEVVADERARAQGPRSEPRGPGSIGARSVAAPQFPLTRPLGDLSPGGRGEEMRPNDEVVADERAGAQGPRSEPRRSGSIGARSVAAPQFPLTRPLGDLSPSGRGEGRRPIDEVVAEEQARAQGPRSEACGSGSIDARSGAAPQFPLTRPLGDLSPSGRGEGRRPIDEVVAEEQASAQRARSSAGAGRAELRRADSGPAAYVVRCACAPGPDGTRGGTVVDHVRLFPIWPGVRWSYRVHEQILPSLKRAKIPVRWTDLVVTHTGYINAAGEARKLDRNIKILRRELEEKPNDPFVLFNLGMSAVERRQWPEARAYLERSLAGSAPADSIVRKIYALLARAHQNTGDLEETLRTCEEGLRLDPDDAELWHRKAIAHRHRREPGEAERCWRRILVLKRPDRFCSFDQGLYGHITRRNLAALAAERGDYAEAQSLWREVLAERPGDRDALANLM